MDGRAEPGDQAGDPARAFEDLRAEVSIMRRAVEALPRALAENLPPAPPDYRSDIGKVTQALLAVVGRLDVIEKHPALRLTPEQHRQAIASAGSELMRGAAGKLDKATEKHAQAAEQFAGMIGTIREQDSQSKWVAYTALATFVAGILFSPFLAAVLPYGLDGRVAALIMQEDRWDAGWDLLKAGNPAGRDDAAYGYNLVQANRDAIHACQQSALKAGKDQKCQIIVKVPQEP